MFSADRKFQIQDLKGALWKVINRELQNRLKNSTTLNFIQEI